MCVQEDHAALCIVRDLSPRTDGTVPPVFSVSVQGSTTVRQFVQQVASHFSYEPSNIELVLSLTSGDDVSNTSVSCN